MLLAMNSAPQSALLALGKLDGRLSGHPLAAAWASRRRLRAAVDGAAVDGCLVDPERLVRLVAGLPLTRWRDAGADAAAVRLYELAAEPSAAADHLHSYLQEATISAAVQAVGVAVAEGLPRSSVVASFAMVLRQIGATEALLVGVSPVGRAGDGWQALLASAESGRRELDTLTFSWSRWTRALGRRRSTSRHLEVLAAAAATTVAAPAQVARLLGMTSRGAAMLLSELSELGILREVSGRETWQVYACADVPVGEGMVVPARPDVHVPDLSAVFAELERASAAVARRLPGLHQQAPDTHAIA